MSVTFTWHNQLPVACATLAGHAHATVAHGGRCHPPYAVAALGHHLVGTSPSCLTGKADDPRSTFSPSTCSWCNLSAIQYSFVTTASCVNCPGRTCTATCCDGPGAACRPFEFTLRCTVSMFLQNCYNNAARHDNKHDTQHHAFSHDMLALDATTGLIWPLALQCCQH